jgi:hypothetical protein
VFDHDAKILNLHARTARVFQLPQELRVQLTELSGDASHLVLLGGTGALRFLYPNTRFYRVPNPPESREKSLWVGLPASGVVRLVGIPPLHHHFDLRRFVLVAAAQPWRTVMGYDCDWGTEVSGGVYLRKGGVAWWLIAAAAEP